MAPLQLSAFRPINRNLPFSVTYRTRTVPKNEHSSSNLAHQTISAELYKKTCLGNTALAHLGLLPLSFVPWYILYQNCTRL